MSAAETPGDGSGVPPLEDLEELVLEIRGGSLIAFRLVAERVRRILRFRGYRMPAEDRRDLEQEILIQIWQATQRSGFDARGGFWGFVEVVTVRRCIDWLRGRKPMALLADEHRDSAAGPLGSLLRDERLGLAKAALERLDAPCRELIRMRFDERRPYRELALRLDRSEGALRAQMYRCIRQVREILAEMTAAREPREPPVESAR